ncbi:MAG: hypothetical protein MI743_10305 [Sneathiellales bacterium]|nr:hypothetical protein [Sneathiellales bacterium]
MPFSTRAGGLIITITCLIMSSFLPTFSPAEEKRTEAQLGPRPLYLVNDLEAGALKEKLQSCAAGPFYPSDFSIGHRGAPLQFPEHTKESYEAAAQMGAGIIECDVTFTKDKELVCRHSQCDLHQTTDILLRPDVAAKCSAPFSPAQDGQKATAKCCTSDITLAEFKSLNGKMDGFNPKAKTVEEFVKGTSGWRTDLYAHNGTLMTHKESLALINKWQRKFTPELKKASVSMPYNGNFSQADYAQKLVDDYRNAGIDPDRVYLQSFNLDDIKYWIKNEPDFAKQAVFLDGRYRQVNPNNPASFTPTMKELATMGVRIIAPPLWMLVTLDQNGKIIPSAYAIEAKKAGLKMIAWSLERSGPLHKGGGWYYKSVKAAIKSDGDMLKLLDVLAKDVGVIGVFSDWPATTTFYANCAGQH